MAREQAERIVDRITSDIEGRQAIGDEMGNVDDETRAEIHETWIGIILNEVAL